ncbi:MAG: hypothetical protein ACNYNY_04810 [Candidatus Oxydemutatoraceae bacterium WSBS_2016_MAG_OTU14]
MEALQQFRNITSAASANQANSSLFSSSDGKITQAPKSFLGRAVLFIREKLGLNKSANKEITKLFIDSISQKYHQDGLGDSLIAGLKHDLEKGKPLKLRDVRNILEEADAWDTSDFDDMGADEDVLSKIRSDKSKS